MHHCARNFTTNWLLILLISLLTIPVTSAQVEGANHSGFTWISTADVSDMSYGAGYTVYSAAWPIFKQYPGARDFQMGLGGCWLTTQRTGNEPEQFYTTIEGGLGWWHDTRFGRGVPKFIMGGVSYNFYAWANGPGAGRSANLGNGQRDWSTPGGKYGVAQLSNRLLWAPDGLNMAQSLNGELLGYGYTPLPLTEPISNTGGQGIETGNQCWTLFLNTTNFKGPATFFLPTFWTEPVLEDPSIEGLFLDSRPSDPNITFGVEHAASPALVSTDAQGNHYAKIEPLQYPVNLEDNTMVLNKVSVYSHDALWNRMVSWFNGGEVVKPGINESGIHGVDFINGGGSMIGEIVQHGGSLEKTINLTYMDNVQQNENIMGYEFDTSTVQIKDNMFLMPEYFKLESDRWQAIEADEVPSSTNLVDANVPLTPRPEITYLTPLDPECQWQDPNGPWNNPGPTAGPFKAELGDGSTVTYYWYRFVDQPAIVHANYSEETRALMQERAELIHSNWKHTDDYLVEPEIGQIATLDPGAIVEPPAGLEVGYVPIVTRQEKTPSKVRVFVLAGQSNMQGYGTINDADGNPGTLVDIVENDRQGNWSELGAPGDWNVLEGASIYFANGQDTLKSKVTVGQGANPNLIGPELMFAHQLDDYYEDPVLIIKTAWGGKSLAVDFRPPSAGGETGEFYQEMIETVQNVTNNLGSEFPEIGITDYEISGFAWFQGWNDGASDDYLNEYESNLHHLVGDIRNDLGVSNLPVVIASSGHGGYELSSDGWVRTMQEVVSVAQENVGCNDTLYGGLVGFVDTKRFYLPETASPENAIHHFNNNALTYLNVGKSVGNEMIKAINHMSFCYEDCSSSVSPGLVSIGNRVWNDLDRDGINDPEEPGIPGVSLVCWADTDGDDIPDWQGFLGVEVTDDEGYYRFQGLQPGPYLVFVWSVDNWGPGEPLENFVSTNNFVADADNDVDFDNNGSGDPFTDIRSGIVFLTEDGEPLNDGDPFNCYFNYDAGGNNTVDFGFYDPDVSTSTIDLNEADSWVDFYPNPASNQLVIKSTLSNLTFELTDITGRVHRSFSSSQVNYPIDVSSLPNGMYLMKVYNEERNEQQVYKLVKQ